MQFASLIGFAAVFVAFAWGVSLMARLGASIGAPAARLWGPAAERRVIELASYAPLFAASAVLVVLLGSSISGGDHCEHHPHEAHLCLVHGAAWANQTWAIALVTLGGSILVFRVVRIVVRRLAARGALARLRRMSRVDGDIRWLETSDLVCFVTRDGEIFVSTGAWSLLDDDERAAVLAHERAHIVQCDVARGLQFELLELVAAPLVTLRARWSAATERLCDTRAADSTGDAESVASAIVKLARLGRVVPVGVMTFGPDRDCVAARVRALLAGFPPGDQASRRAFQIACAVAVTGFLVLAMHASLLHDVIEDLAG